MPTIPQFAIRFGMKLSGVIHSAQAPNIMQTAHNQNVMSIILWPPYGICILAKHHTGIDNPGLVLEWQFHNRAVVPRVSGVSQNPYRLLA